MSSVRFVKNVNLKVTYEGEDTMVPFGTGDIYRAVKIEIDAEGYANIHMPDGSVIKGVDDSVFENMGKQVPVEHVKALVPVEENAVIAVEEKPIEPALLDGTMLSNEGEPDVGSEPQPPATEDGGY